VVKLFWLSGGQSSLARGGHFVRFFQSNLQSEIFISYKVTIPKEYRRGNKKLPIKSDEESSLVDKVSEISNLELLKDLNEMNDFIRYKQLSFKAP